MKIKFKENEQEREIDVDKITVIDRDGTPFRMTQDVEKGIYVLADDLFCKIYVEPNTSNSLTILSR